MKPLPDRLRKIGCDREPFTPDHAHCVCRLANDAADEIERLSRVDEDHKNVLRAALAEPNGVDLTHRLTSYALSQRNKHPETVT